MDSNIRRLCVFLLVVCFVTDVRSDCPCSNYTTDGGHFPKQAMKWREFESLFIDGQSMVYLELYNLKPKGQFPDLTNVIYQWIKSNGVYINPVSGWLDLGIADFPPFCYDDTVDFSRMADSDELRFHSWRDSVQFEFDILLPSPGRRYVGTLLSSCPEKYLINWYCPKDRLSNKYCNGELQMNLATTTGLDNIPWHLISRDLCRNKLPYLDESRWHFTHFGIQCPLTQPPVSQRRKRREDSESSQSYSLDRSFWP